MQSSQSCGAAALSSQKRSAAAALLVASRLSGSKLDRLPEAITPSTELEGYLVQRAAHRLLEESGFGKQAGWKIGCTTPVMQTYLGISNPSAGGVFAANTWHREHEFVCPDERKLGVECEIAVRIGRDLTGQHKPYGMRDIIDGISACMAAIEIVEDRYVDYSLLDTPTLIADDFFHYSCVLGDPTNDVAPTQLRNVTATMTINGATVGGGSGRDILGEPLNVLRWLVNSCVEWGTPVLRGDVILLGSLVATNWVGIGDSVTISNDRLGDVAASFI
jgi:2-keto-4-pentenoate hydratase